MRIPTPGQLANTKPCHYKLVDGALEVFGSGHVISRQSFQDFHLHVEVYLPDGPSINSGIWIAFRYGVEIGSRDRGPLYQLGSLYGMKVPDKDAMRTPPSWNELDIDFTAPRFDKDGKKTVNAKITVCLNGEKIHDGVDLPGTTKTLQEPEAPTPGPIVLENHKTAKPVRFRNVWIVLR
ncbi:MAG: DUF1080 domain-containing protein [Kiritimatiellae bacterium]|nr:DUF1080 domain-containing protein [Kiritimatiellia bacterium]